MSVDTLRSGRRLRALADDPLVNPYADAKMFGADIRPEERRLAVKKFTIPSTDGSVTLYGPEIDVIATPDFQRLEGIKQLGTSYVVYRGAQHSRFVHSLGTLHMADKILRAARQNPSLPAADAKSVLDPSAHRIVRLAALLHDITHVPFGHTLEDEFGLLQRHDANGLRFRVLLGKRSKIARVLLPLIGPDEWDELHRVLRAKSEEEFAALDRPFLADMVGNTVCADILDYVRRDLESCGMDVAITEHYLDYFTVTDAEGLPKKHRKRMALVLDKRGMPRPDVESEVVMVLTLRYELAERVYFHHAKNSASVMIARAVHDLGLARGPEEPEEGEETWSPLEDRNFHGLSDDLLLHVLREPRLAGELGLTIHSGLSGTQLATIADLGDRLLKRDLYKLVYLAVTDDLAHRAELLHDRWGTPAKRRELEDRLAAAAGLRPGQVLVHLPRPRMMRKRADVRIIVGDRSSVTTLNEWDALHSRRIDALNGAHGRLWRVGVYVHPKYADDLVSRRLLQGAAEDAFGPRSRYQREESMPYLDAVWEAEAADPKNNLPSNARREVLEEVRRRLQPSAPAAFGILSLADARKTLRATVSWWQSGMK